MRGRLTTHSNRCKGSRRDTRLRRVRLTWRWTAGLEAVLSRAAPEHDTHTQRCGPQQQGTRATHTREFQPASHLISLPLELAHAVLPLTVLPALKRQLLLRLLHSALSGACALLQPAPHQSRGCELDEISILFARRLDTRFTSALGMSSALGMRGWACEGWGSPRVARVHRRQLLLELRALRLRRVSLRLHVAKALLNRV